MSTAWMPESRLEGEAATWGFSLELVVHEFGPPEPNPPKEFRVINKSGLFEFQGDANRCSDFLCGYARAMSDVVDRKEDR